MKKTLFVLGVLVLISGCASSQVSATVSGGASHPIGGSASTGIPGACSPCLWYSGDTDPANPNFDGLFNSDARELPLKGQVWVPFIASSDGDPLHKHVLISAVTFNLLVPTPDTNPPGDFAGMTYGFRTDVSAGNGGSAGRKGTCAATSVTYTGLSIVGYNEYSFTCDLKSKPVKVGVGKIYWVNVLPTFTSTNYAYLDDAIDIPGINQFGWSDDFYNSFFDSTDFGATFSPATSGCSGCQQFSVAIAGTYTL